MFHDCGKLTEHYEDEKGFHFPNHAENSYKMWLALSKNPLEATLMRRDMEIHLLKAEGIEDFCKQPYAILLLIIGLSEILANAKLFGGFESTSFKIKFKHITKRGNKIIELLKKEAEEDCF